MTYSAPTFLAAALLIGCAESPVSTNVSAQVPSQGSFVMAVPDGYERAPTREQREADFTASADFRAELRSIIATSGDFRQMDAAVQELLDRSTEIPEFEREQIAATYMLQMELTKGDAQVSNAKANVIASYLQMLLKHRNPDAALISASLERLENHWSEEEIQSAAQVAFNAAEDLLEAQASCEECGIDKAFELSSTRSGHAHNASASNIYSGAMELQNWIE